MRLIPPTVERVASSGWGQSRAYRDGWHEGIDFPSKIGSPVLAAAAGTVVHVDNSDDSFAGKWIGIDHGGLVTRYMHNRVNLVKKGQRVSAGQKIGEVGATGTSGAGSPHVHFDIKLSESVLKWYKSLYGSPSTGFGEKTTWGYGAPAETFMSNVRYMDGGAAARKRGVVFYRPSANRVVALAIGAGAGYLLWRVIM